MRSRRRYDNWSHCLRRYRPLLAVRETKCSNFKPLPSATRDRTVGKPEASDNLVSVDPGAGRDYPERTPLLQPPDRGAEEDPRDAPVGAGTPGARRPYAITIGVPNTVVNLRNKVARGRSPGVPCPMPQCDRRATAAAH